MQLEPLLRKLSADERARAAKFYFDKDREHFIVARGLLRTILGRYLDREPENLSFRYGPQGKPALAEISDGHAIRFNLSHSHGFALYAIARGREVGIDIEWIRPDLAIAEIAERFFSASEAALLRSLPAEARLEAFFRCWTRKEAYIKARGEGLSRPLNQIDLPLARAEPGLPQALQLSSSEVTQWSLQDLTPARDNVAAVVAEGRDWHTACWRWPGESGQSA